MVNIHYYSERNSYFLLCLFLAIVMLQGCSNIELKEQGELANTVFDPRATKHEEYRYLVGPGDTLDIFVWKNPEVSSSLVVRPDGFINAPLLEEVHVSGKIPSEIESLIEESLSEYIREPIVTVTVRGFDGPYKEQVRVIGGGIEAKAFPYKEDMKLIDVIVLVGEEMSEYADRNGAILSRVIDGKYEQYNIRMEDLIQDGDMTANVDILPGDIIIVPESWF